MVITALNDDDWYRKILERMLEHRADAVFCALPPAICDIEDTYHRTGVPLMALIQRSKDESNIPLVTADVETPARQAFTRLKALGHESGLVLFRHGAADRASHYISAAQAADICISLGDADAMKPEEFLNAVRSEANTLSFIMAPHRYVLELEALCNAHAIHIPDDLTLIAVGKGRLPEDKAQSYSTITMD